jgi:hypothetical protein
MGEGNRFLALRGSLLDAQGAIRKDIFKPRGDIHLNVAGTQIASLRIRKVLEIMLPALAQAPVPVPGSVPAQAPAPAPVQTPPAPVQTPPAKSQRVRVQAPVQDEVPAPVAANMPPVVGAPLAAVVNVPAIVQNVAVQNVVPETSTAMEVEEDEDALLARLFFKRFGRALPDEKEKEKDVDINFVIDLTDDSEEMEVAAPVLVVKTESIEAAEAPEIVTNVANVANVNNVNNVNNESKVAANQRCASRRLELIELAMARKAINEFGKSLRKTAVIQEKEAPENVIATEDTDMAEANSVNIEMAEQVIAESDRRA